MRRSATTVFIVICFYVFSASAFGMSITIVLIKSFPNMSALLVAGHRYCRSIPTFTEEQGDFADGSGPQPYESNLFCQYIIRPSPPASIISVRFLSISVEGDPRYDYVSLTQRNGLSLGINVLFLRSRIFIRIFTTGTFFGRSPPDPIHAVTNELWITFKTDGSVQDDGWRITYTSNSSVKLPPNFYLAGGGVGGRLHCRRLVGLPCHLRVTVRHGDIVHVRVHSLCPSLRGCCW